MMLLMKPQVIAFHYVLKDAAGKLIESSKEEGDPVLCMEGAGQIIPALEKVLLKLKKGEKKEVSLKAAEAYGEQDKRLILDVPRDQLPKGALKVGQQLQSQSPEGHVQVFVVTALTESHATLDGNHPLAGQDLTFNVEVTERREATDEEVTHGHAHGAGGHHHH